VEEDVREKVQEEDNHKTMFQDRSRGGNRQVEDQISEALCIVEDQIVDMEAVEEEGLQDKEEEEEDHQDQIVAAEDVGILDVVGVR